MDHFCIYVSFLSCFSVCSLQPSGADNLLGKGWPLGSLVYYVLLCVLSSFHMLCLGLGVILDCIDS